MFESTGNPGVRPGFGFFLAFWRLACLNRRHATTIANPIPGNPGVRPGFGFFLAFWRLACLNRRHATTIANPIPWRHLPYHGPWEWSSGHRARRRGPGPAHGGPGADREPWEPWGQTGFRVFSCVLAVGMFESTTCHDDCESNTLAPFTISWPVGMVVRTSCTTTGTGTGSWGTWRGPCGEAQLAGVRLRRPVEPPAHRRQDPPARPRRGMQRFLSSYANASARRHRFSGHVFQGRYRTELVEDESYLWTVSRYVHLNPVRAGLVEHPAAWRWSSYPGYADRRRRLEWVAHDELLKCWAGRIRWFGSGRGLPAVRDCRADRTAALSVVVCAPRLGAGEHRVRDAAGPDGAQ